MSSNSTYRYLESVKNLYTLADTDDTSRKSTMRERRVIRTRSELVFIISRLTCILNSSDIIFVQIFLPSFV